MLPATEEIYFFTFIDCIFVMHEMKSDTFMYTVLHSRATSYFTTLESEVWTSIAQGGKSPRTNSVKKKSGRYESLFLFHPENFQQHVS